jgi:ribosome-binding protein aMBF1 (putative translation factor)
MKAKSGSLDRVKPRLDELLPTQETRDAFDDASASLEAGRLIREMREHAGLSQTELAEKLRISQSRISAVETGGGRDGPSYALLRRIVIACGGRWETPNFLLRSIPGKHQAAE